MDEVNGFAAYPKTVKTGAGESRICYSRIPGFAQVIDLAKASGRPGDGEILFHENEEAADNDLCAVPLFRREPDGVVSAPTGWILTRAPEGTIIGERESEFNAVGYRITERLSYAPHAAWLCAVSDKVCDALSGIERLAALPGIEAVEPQWISARSRR